MSNRMGETYKLSTLQTATEEPGEREPAFPRVEHQLLVQGQSALETYTQV